MGKGKLKKFEEMETFKNVFQYPFSVISNSTFTMQGHWNRDYFGNDNPIVVELGCGRGEYTVEMAKMFPQKNYIGVDIKGSRMWTGAKEALTEGLANVAFLRTNIEIIERFFAKKEVSELWLTFSDPQMKNANKRLTGTMFMNRYKNILVDNGLIHLKTDSNFLYTYTKLMAEMNKLPLVFATDDLYNTKCIDADTSKILSIRTYYEQMWIDRGISIKYIKMRLPHDNELREPLADIPKDVYRSYHRDINQ